MRSLFACFLWLFAFSNMPAETIVLEYDPSCMDMYEYRNPSGSVQLLSFSPHSMSATERVVLEVGTRKGQRVRAKPRLLTECGSLTIALRLVQRINRGATELYVARPDGKGYILYRVDKAYYYFPKGGQVEFWGAKVHFQFDPLALEYGTDLALDDSKSSVYYTGQRIYECFTGFAFRKILRAKQSVIKDFILVPEIGIVEKDEGNAHYGLHLVNGAILDSYLKERCSSTLGAGYGQWQTQNTISTPTTYGQREVFTPPQPPTHIVQHGETLYSIARHYGISLQQLIEWNQLRTNLIKPGMALIVGDPVVALPSSQKLQGTASIPKKDMQVRSTMSPKEGLQAKTPPVPQTAMPPAWVDPPAYHIVQPGETLPQLAQHYGYTEERFRWMNDLAPDEPIRPGMRLRTSDCLLATPNSTSPVHQRPKGGNGTEPTAYDYRKPIPSAMPSTAAQDYSKLRIHIVSEGETLYQIAALYGMTLDELVELNNLHKGEVLLPGQRLYVR